MLIALLVAAYCVIGIGSAWAAVRSFQAPLSFWGRNRLRVCLLVAAEAFYVLQAPACVYLPRAPGKPAVERVILGADASNRLYWLERTRNVAFAWGPRWWFFI